MKRTAQPDLKENLGAGRRAPPTLLRQSVEVELSRAPKTRRAEQDGAALRSPIFTRAVMWCAAAILAAFNWSASAWAQSNCQSLSNLSLVSSTTANVTPAYDPFSPTDRTRDFFFTISNANSSSCTVMVAFVKKTDPVMTSGSFSLKYGMEKTDGSSAVNIGGGIANSYSGTLGGFSSGSGILRIRIPAGQTSALAGAYSDPLTELSIYGWQSSVSDFRFARSYSFQVTTTIDRTCTMSTPSPSVLNFSSAVALGLPNPSFVLTSTLSNINCTYPARLTLSGVAMQRSPAAAFVAGFDDFIDWQATATFGSATATLITTGATTVTSADYNVKNSTTVGGAFSVDVNLVSGQRLHAGSYSSALTVTVDPTP